MIDVGRLTAHLRRVMQGLRGKSLDELVEATKETLRDYVTRSGPHVETKVEMFEPGPGDSLSQVRG